MIPNADPKAQYLSHRNEIDAALRRVLDGGRFILGEEVAALEEEFAAYVGVRHAVGVGSGTEALHLALKACGVGRGKEVVTVSHTAVATVAAVSLAGGRAVFTDIEADYFTMDPRGLEAAVTARTRAVVPVHLYGQAADMEPIMEVAKRHGLFVVEDCAQAHGATYRGRRVGSFGHLGCFSFYPTKNLGALGDGGMVVTDDEGLAKRVRLLREYGWEERYVSSCRGWNSRLDEIQAAVLRVKLRHLDKDNKRRREIAALYDGCLEGLDLVTPKVREGCGHVYHLYVIRSPRRGRLMDELSREGIGVNVHYPVPVHLQKAYRRRGHRGGLEETERAAREILSLPIFPELTDEAVRKVADVIRKCHERRGP
ncbi:MAG TPA: DegT/DnrJ/EryC1/StrS family aminotransferase [Syntrophales bacterium]|nr:DegT/DnrJ/EryC1/StrS family aminotransferase [Syntrophales bacterium]HRS87493.1 DegT/DnrJ/EryC1/StrS family aminotransferase [Syntrophales bacterium]HRV43087.1 DegT/DnrJ/EryC1/StrS family aminotransferase [Syntrophales bacterium]